MFGVCGTSMMAARVMSPSYACGCSWRSVQSMRRTVTHAVGMADVFHSWRSLSLPFSACVAAPQNGRPPSITDVSGRGTEELSPRLLQVVLVSPQIPGNTGSVARTCAATGIGLHLVEPLGYEISDSKLKRAGLDYWPYVVVKVHPSWDEFYQYFLLQEGEKRLIAFTKKGTTLHTDVGYRPGDWLLFGSETNGLPDEAIQECVDGHYAGGTARIPMSETYVRCLNLSVSVGIGMYEALRQLGQMGRLGDPSNEETPAMADAGGWL